jgi:very-short-patch-repair endonuclease
MTPAERALWNGLRIVLADARFRCQVPFGPYYADFASHRCRLIVEVDGSQHGEALDYDAARTHFLEGEGYRVLRFWNNEVLKDLDAVLTAIAATLPSPLVGCAGKPRPTRLSPVRGTGRPGHGGPKGRMGGARRSRARSAGPHPHPSPPHKGEGGNDNLQLESD